MESEGDFPFRKIRYDIYLPLEVMMYVEHLNAYKFMFKVNKEGRKYLFNNFKTVRNGFINDGLIDLYFSNEELSFFNNY